MKHILLSFCTVFLGGALVTGSPRELAAETLTLEQAVENALANYPSIQIQRYLIEEAKGRRTTASQLPNPELSYTKEDLGLAGLEGGEWIMAASLPLTFLWTRSPMVEAAENRVKAEKFALAHWQNMVKYKVRKAYFGFHYAALNYQAWQKTSKLFLQVARTSAARLTEGDISGYEQQRIALEILRYNKAETEAEVDFINSRRRLAFLIDPDRSEKEYETIVEFSFTGPEIKLEELLDQALQNRSDLQVARVTLQVRKAELGATRREGLPELSISLGYKKQVDDFRGTVGQLRVGVPIFNRNRGGVQSAVAVFNQQNYSVGLLEKQIRNEVRQAYSRYKLYRKLLQQFEMSNLPSPDLLLDVAKFSYAEGEMSLVELLDGVRAYSEAFQARFDLRLKYLLSIFELEKAAATTFFK